MTKRVVKTKYFCYYVTTKINYKIKLEEFMDFVADNTVNKLILLFVLDKMDIPLTETSILEICASQNSWVNYMDCKDLLYQLLTAKFIYKPNTTNNESRYNITVAGRECLSQFFTKIPAVLGHGFSEPKMGDGIWPQLNTMYIIFCTEDEEKIILSIIEDLRKEYIGEGIACFVSDAEVR